MCTVYHTDIQYVNTDIQYVYIYFYIYMYTYIYNYIYTYDSYDSYDSFANGFHVFPFDGPKKPSQGSTFFHLGQVFWVSLKMDGW